MESDMEKIEKIYGWSDILYMEENMLHYRPGGYHPVALGDTMKDDRYKVLHKLGYETASMPIVLPLILALGEGADNLQTRAVGGDQNQQSRRVKADESKQPQELQHHRALLELAKGDLRSKHIVQLFDDFTVDGPNGSHLCLVLELLAPPVDWMISDEPDECYYPYERLDPVNSLMISTNLLEALIFLQENGYAHGDISTKNIAYTCDLLSHLSENELLKVLGDPETVDIRRVDGQPLAEGIPRQFIRSTAWPGYPHDDDDVDDDFRFFDLGEAFTQDTTPKKLAGHICYLSVGYLPWHIHQWPMNDLRNSSKGYFDEWPKEWQKNAERLRRDAEEEYGRALRGEREPPGLELEVEFKKYVPEPELQVLLPVIRGLTQLSPSSRMSAGQALFLVGMPHEDCYATDEGRNMKSY
ncbi:hypothetical protein EDD37DRAFT_678918 [Exophiala viscosa]|uniref:non-specific serine/threonine protein kinase n=1 Tax=Exophiala viscosa TaxID=2486360 RepID=A0AAN6ICT2_9EURO|nr:hypothetical protein EDD36DRAFT_487777 [Exophiala viscosa]KAI1625787.1 hypothetical protein EDD37DRAFT_678918 [Exophiala viscosa]